VLGGSLGSGAAWTWYANNCNGISIGTGGSITVTPNSTATYFVRAEGSCNITPCASVTITVKPISIIPSGITADKSAICQGDSARLTISGGSLGTGAAWEWYSGSCTGGTYLGVGTSIVVKPTSTTQYSLRGRGDCNTTDWVGETITVNMPSQAPTTTSASSAIICQGASTTLSVSGGALGTGAVWQWYSGSCGGTKIDTGISISVSPTLTTTYYVRAEGTCNTTTCSSIIVNVDSLSVAPSSASANPSAICPGAQSVLTVNGGKLGSGAKWKWYAGSCGGTPIDSGASITVWPATAKNYYVRAEGKCNSTNCAVISVSIKATSLAPTSASAIPEAVCNGITSTLSIIGGVLNNGDVWKWYANSCGGTLVGTGAQINVAPSAPTTYFVRAEGECGLTQCASVAVDYVTNTKPVFIYPTNNQQLDFEGDYIFRTQKVCGSTGYLWGFFQNNILIWENYRDEGHLSGVDYAIQAGTLAHSKFQAGSVTVSIRASVNNNWTNATTIIINLVPR
jgi:hypothetical protein